MHRGRAAWGRGRPWPENRFCRGSGREDLGTPGSDAAGQTEPGGANLVCTLKAGRACEGEGPGLRSRQPGLGAGADLVPGLCVCNSPGRITSYFNAHQFNQPALLLLCRANLRDCPLDVGNGHTVQTGRDLPQRAPQAQTGYVRAAGEGEVPFPSSFNLSDRRHRNAKF